MFVAAPSLVQLFDTQPAVIDVLRTRLPRDTALILRPIGRHSGPYSTLEAVRALLRVVIAIEGSMQRRRQVAGWVGEVLWPRHGLRLRGRLGRAP